MADCPAAPKRTEFKVRTLDKWVRHLLEVPTTIECPHMQILGHDGEEPLFSGYGHLLIRSTTQMEFVIHATPANPGEAFSRIVQAQKNPDSVLDQFRLIAVDYDGMEWACGYVILNLGGTSKTVWRLSGSFNSMTTDVSGSDVSPTKGIEVVYATKLRIPTRMNLVTTVQLDNNEVLWSRRMGNQIVEAVGTRIEFSHATEGGLVWATAETSEEFCHPYAENWVSEPLQILLGQLIFPRLVARNLGDGTSIIWLRPSPTHSADSSLSSLLSGDSWSKPDLFWQLYSDILTMVVNDRDSSGSRNFQANPLTHYYHEVAQATTGSLWVLCMTLASAIEGIAGLLTPPEQRRSEINPESIAALQKYINSWTGDNALRARTVSAVARLQDTGAAQWLRTLAQAEIITAEQVKTWQAVRNKVMHGNLVAPWRDTELEQKIATLSALLHNLSTEHIHRCVARAG